MQKTSTLQILQTIKWDCKLYTNEFENLDEISKFLEKWNFFHENGQNGIHKTEIYESELTITTRNNLEESLKYSSNETRYKYVQYDSVYIKFKKMGKSKLCYLWINTYE